ncbi:interferon-induced protein 44-like isoform X2 [Boleophthalmus pectinirostris]|nr:interferon-induced protein 44-like isoform X2 [Boleophthalmus pectinirostris]XP_055004725.1 interferon-induced protein 44-like isoform X2 [Boleophthalmus pectinirostris]
MGDFQPYQTDVEHIRILLCGPSNAGKSTFINSVETALRGRMTGQALAGGDSDNLTTKYQTYKIQQGKPESFYPFVFKDTMGLEKGQSRGICVDDIKLAMKGHMKDGYVFNPHSPFKSTDPHYNNSPTLKEHTHVLVCVVSAGTLPILSEELLEKMRELRLAAQEFGIPQMAILTKIDEACPDVQADIKNVYRSKVVKDVMETLSSSLDIPLDYIFPVKNYHCEICADEEMEKLILTALKQMIDFGKEGLASRDLD